MSDTTPITVDPGTVHAIAAIIEGKGHDIYEGRAYFAPDPIEEPRAFAQDAAEAVVAEAFLSLAARLTAAL